MARTFVPTPGLEAALLRSTELANALEGMVDDAVREAVRLAPERLGFLKDSIEGEVGIVDGQLIGRVRALDFKAPWYEFGSVRTRPEPFLRPGVEAAVPGARWERRR